VGSLGVDEAAGREKEEREMLAGKKTRQ